MRFGGNAGAPVDDVDLHVAAVGAGGDAYGFAAGVVAHGVRDQVDEYAFQQGGVGRDLGQVGRYVGFEAVAQRAEVVHGVRQHVLDRHRFEPHAEGSGLEAAHVEQVGHEAVQLDQRLVGSGEQFAPILLGPRDVGAA